MANPVQPNRPWELIQQNRRKLRTLADPAQVLAQTPQVIVEGTTDRDPARSSTSSASINVESFAGDGTTKTFGLGMIPMLNGAWVYVDRTPQIEGTDYTVDYGTGVVTFTAAPASGTVPWVRYLSFGTVPPVPPAPVAFAAAKHAGTGTPPALPLGATTEAGDLIVLFVTQQSAAGVTAVSGCGATWSKVDGALPFDNTSVWVGQNCTAGGSSVTYTASSGEYAAAALIVRGAATSGAVASHSTLAGTSGNPPRTGAVTVAAGQIAVGYWHDGWPDTGGFSDTPSAWDLWFPTAPEYASFGNANVMYPATFTGTGTAEHVAAFNATSDWWGCAVVLTA